MVSGPVITYFITWPKKNIMADTMIVFSFALTGLTVVSLAF
jgi:hypothetical protein